MANNRASAQAEIPKSRPSSPSDLAVQPKDQVLPFHTLSPIRTTMLGAITRHRKRCFPKLFRSETVWAPRSSANRVILLRDGMARVLLYATASL